MSSDRDARDAGQAGQEDVEEESGYVSMEIPPNWCRAADEMGVSRAEYVRRMIRAGRRQFGYDYEPDEVPADVKKLKLRDSEDGLSEIDDLFRKVIARNLSIEDPITPEELAQYFGEERIKQVLDELKDEGLATDSYEGYYATEKLYSEEEDDQ